jgi:hypothetical protein
VRTSDTARPVIEGKGTLTSYIYDCFKLAVPNLSWSDMSYGELSMRMTGLSHSMYNVMFM